MKNRQYALVGHGLQGPMFRTYVRGVGEHEPIGTITALVDSDPERLAQGQQALQLAADRCFSDDNEMLSVLRDDIDGVLVATPAGVRDPVMNAINAGKHVFCENPLATNRSLARSIAALAYEHNVVVTVNEQWQFLPSIGVIRQNLAERIGQISCITIGGKGRSARDEMLRIGSHLLSVTINCFTGLLFNCKTVTRNNGADIVGTFESEKGPLVIAKFLSDQYDVGRCYILIEGTMGCALAIGGLLERLYWRLTPYDSISQAWASPFEHWEQVKLPHLWTIQNGDEPRAMADPNLNRTFWLIRQWAGAISGQNPNPSPPENYYNVIGAMDDILA